MLNYESSTSYFFLKRHSYQFKNKNTFIIKESMDGYIVCFVCWGSMSLLNICGHIAMVPACSSGNLTNVLPYRYAMLQTQYMTPHPFTEYRHRTDLSMCYPLMWSVTGIHNYSFKCLLVRPDRKSFPNLPHTTAKAGPVECKSITLSTRPQLLLGYIVTLVNLSKEK